MAANTAEVFPQIPKLERDHIPELLRTIPRWVLWRAGPIKPSGKFDKVPCRRRGWDIDAQDPRNWMTYEAAALAYDQGKCDGIGIVLSSKHTIVHDGIEYYLTALDFDRCAANNEVLKELWLKLGKPYVEVSPSGTGLRMFALSTQVLKGGDDNKGHELYCGGRFMTVTGTRGRGQIRDATDRLIQLHAEWFPPKPKKDPAAIAPSSLPETEHNIRRIEDLLSFISSDLGYETWRNIVWSILSTGWNSAEAIAREWSMRAESRYDEGAFDALIGSFDPTRGITLGTLYHHAEQNGWKKSQAADWEPPDWEPARFDDPDPGIPHADGSASTSRRLLTAEQVKAIPAAPYRLRGLLPATGLASLYGESGSGKSFLAMDLVFAIAVGFSEWFGMAIKPAPVVYIALEGRSGVSKRIKAWEKHYDRSLTNEVRFLLSDFTLLDDRGVAALAAEIVAKVGTGSVVVVDTLNQSAPGADENSSVDMGRIRGNAERLGQLVQGLVLLVHHSGKDRTKGMRGHSSLHAAMDAVLEVSATKAGRSWTIAKAKDDEGGAYYDFELVSYVVGLDEDGRDLTSCAVRRTVNVPVAKAKPLSGKNQIAAMVRIRQLLSAAPTGIDHPIAVREVAKVLDCPNPRKAAVAKDTIDRLIVNGHLHITEGGIQLS